MGHCVPPIHRPDYDDPKELYAFHGLAAYYAQCFEQSLILILVILKAMDTSQMKEATYNDVFTAVGRETMGTLINDLKKVSKIGTRLEARMWELNTKRNYLMHSFFQKNSHKLLSEYGQRAVLDELRQMAQVFQDGNKILTDIYEPLWAKCGISQDMVDQEIQKMRAAAEPIRNLV